MSFDSRIGVAGLIVAFLGIGVTILFPSKKWIGYVCFGIAVLLGAIWGRREWLSMPEMREQTVPSRDATREVASDGAAKALLAKTTPAESKAKEKAQPPVPIPKELVIITHLMPSSYPPDFEIAGIKWKDLYTDARVEIRNDNTVVSLENIDLKIEFLDSMQIAGASQLSAIPDVAIMPLRSRAPTDITTFGTDEKGNPVNVPVTGEASFAPFAPEARVLCKRLARDASLHLVLVPVAVNSSYVDNRGQLIFPSNMYGPKRRPHIIKITGQYDTTTESGQHPTYQLRPFEYDYATEHPL